MDTIDKSSSIANEEEKRRFYQQCICQIMDKYAAYRLANTGKIETQLTKDHEQGHYYFLRVGWDGLRYVHAFLMHMDLKKDNKIWVQLDWTEEGVANELVDLGVPKNDIVLGFEAPYRRPYTGFAIE